MTQVVPSRPTRIYRYTYTANSDGKTYIARVTIFRRQEESDCVAYLLQAVGKWPHRADGDQLNKLGVPVVIAAVTTLEQEHEFKGYDLVPEDGWGDS